MTEANVQEAQHFAEAVVDAVFAPWAADLAERAVLSPGERVLDLGCGTGAVARAVAPGDFIHYQLAVNADRWAISDATRQTLAAERDGLEPFVAAGRPRFPRAANIALARRPPSGA